VSTRRDAIARDFDEIARLGFTCARWFLFTDGRAGICYDEGGLPLGVDEYLFQDLDAALEIARARGIRVDFVLTDHRWMFSGLTERVADPVAGVVVNTRLPHGRSHVLLEKAGRDALLDLVIAPVVRRYGPAGDRADLAPAVLAYEFMNEPDFVVAEWTQDLSVQVARPVPFTVVGELVSRVSRIVHEHSTALVTLGCARVRNLKVWDDPRFGLDLLQLHSYPDLRHPDRDTDVYGVPAAALGTTRPVLLGEFPGNGPVCHPPGCAPPPTTLEDYLEFAWTRGYVGAWPWSFSGTDGYGPLPLEPLKRFAERHPEAVNPLSAAGGT
jgi:hypothetical protein